MKKGIAFILAMTMLFALGACSSEGVSQEAYDTLAAERDELNTELDALKIEHENLIGEHENLAEEHKKLSEEYEAFMQEAAPFLKLSEEERAAELARAEQERIEAEEAARLAQEEADRLAAERAAQEEAEAKAAEEARLAEEAKGYETGITFKEISRSPDDYVGKKVKFSGYVLQVIEGSTANAIRMSTSGKYDDVIYGIYDKSILDVRLLDDDKITIYGTVSGLMTYETVMGASVTLPQILIDRIEFN